MTDPAHLRSGLAVTHEETVSVGAERLEALLEAVRSGELVAPPSFVTRLEGALVALRVVGPPESDA